MYLAFNELSVLPLQVNDHILLKHFEDLSETFKQVSNLYGFKQVLYPSDLSGFQVTESKNMAQWVESLPTKERNKIFTVIYRKPFLNDILEEKETEIYSYFFENKNPDIEQQYCKGLATAYLLEIPSISLNNHIFWKKHKINFYKEEADATTEVEVNNISTIESIANKTTQEYLESFANLELHKSDLHFSEKKIHFREDHGIDVLKRFANRIVNSDYVVEVVNSLPFNSHISRFIKNVYKNGQIEIVLYWEDAGYGMLVQTTGRNYRETEAIAEILKTEFDR